MMKIFDIRNKMKLNIKDITRISLFVALSSLSRIGMSSLPNIQLTTIIIILITVNFGLRYGLLVAILTPVTSNLILGTGVWTIWQMISWSLVAIFSFIFKKFKNNIYIMSLVSLISGYIFGFSISIQSAWTYGLNMEKFIVYYLSGLSFDILHSVSNMVFCILTLKKINNISSKYIKGEINNHED